MSKLSLSSTPRDHQPRRSLADLLRLHGEKGRGDIETLHMTDEEEDMLREALDTWVSFFGSSLANLKRWNFESFADQTSIIVLR